jgi:chromosome segregation ATPase
MITVGNLIVIGVVLVILAVYRQMDRNNRSLEKVRRYADKIQIDLDGIVAQKAQELRDMSIEVDVHQKTAREVLKRIQSTEDGLSDRASQIDQINVRINDYDGALDELVQMTRRVEENINRIKDESEYVDKVGKRLTGSSQRMAELEKSMAALVDRFQEMNGASLEKIGDTVLQSVIGKVEGLDERIGKTEARVQKGLAELEKSGQQIAGSLQARAEKVQQAVQDSLAGYLERMRAAEEDYAKKLDDVATRGERLETVALQKVREHVEARMKATSGELTASISEIRSRLDGFQGDSISRIDGYEATIQERLSSVEQDVSRIETDLAERMKDLDEGFGSVEKDATAHLAEVQAQTRELSRAVAADLSREIRTRIAEATDELRRHVAQAQEEFTGEIKRVNDLQKEWEGQRKAVSAQIDEGSRELNARVTEFSKNFAGQLDTRAEEVEQAALARIDERLTTYEDGIGYRFDKLETVQTDIDALEANLRETMNRMMTKLNDEISQLGTRLHEKTRSDIDMHEAEMARVRSSMVELEDGLNELKGRAYENVSEKLKVFEDEFFSDLRERSLSMESRLNDWQSRVQQSLDSMAAEAHDERERVEASYGEELASRLSELKSSLLGNFEQLEQQTDRFRTELDGRMSSADRSVQTLTARLDGELAKLQAEAGEQFSSELSEFRARIDDELRTLSRNIDGRVKDLRDSIDSSHRNLESVVDSAKSDVTVWQSQVLQQLKSSQADVENDFAGFRAQVSDTVSGLRDEFEQQKNDLISQTSEERVQLREEINMLSTRIQELERDLEIRTQTVLDTLASEYQQFQTEFQRKSRDVQSETDTKIREFRGFVHDTREQFDVMQQNLFGRIEQDVNVLTVNLTEIDKRQKAFIEQTRIFERADSLKLSLLESIDEMQRDLVSLDSQRKDLNVMEVEFARLRKLGEDASERLARFMGEKRRIDSIEDDYKRLIGLSQAVELKLQQVTAGNDAIAQVQVSMRGLEDMQKDVESRFQRLEKKRSVLDVTAEGVDKNFQYLEELEEKIGTVRGQLDTLPGQVNELYDKIERLSADRKDVESAMRQLNALDKILSDVEGRMENLQTAREWLARTETRLEEISRSAEEQVKLLGTIMKEDAKGPRERGAPSLGARDTVVKLARQGWKVQEIAQATKLSRGEVELILEMSNK